MSATLEVRTAPAVAELYFWALQVSFATGGRELGAAHLGLQWHPAHPGATAVNWGGYGADGRELAGGASLLPSATGNPNTRDFPWVTGRRYQLRIGPSDRPGWWRGEVDGVAVRDLPGGGESLRSPLVWAEVFAPCDAPPAEVRWSDFAAVTSSGDRLAPDRVLVTYQGQHEGGCATATVEPDGDGVRQVTGVARTTPHGATLPLGP